MVSMRRKGVIYRAIFLLKQMYEVLLVPVQLNVIISFLTAHM